MRFLFTLQDKFHLPFLGFHTHFFIEMLGRGVSSPDVQGHLIAAQCFRLLLYIGKQTFPDVLPPRLLVHAQIVNEQRCKRHHIGGKGLLLDLAEGIADADIVCIGGT